jgi:alpha-galactosidase
MLEIGNGGMSADEYRTHMSLWALLSAPLLLGNDIRSITPETLAIVANPEVIAVDQDTLGRQARRLLRQDATEVWVKPLADGSSVVGLFNRASTPARVSIAWHQLGLGPRLRARELWTHVELGPQDEQFNAQLPPHGVILLKVR